VKDKRLNLKAEDALKLLIQGNARFVSGLKSVETLLSSRNITKLANEGQFPFCIVITSADSRIPIEYVFDRGLGDLFVIRNFDNSIDSAVAASVEYAVMNFGIKLVIVMSHTRSGLVRLTLENEREFTTAETTELQMLVRKTRPIIARARIKERVFGNIDSKTPEREKVFEQACRLSVVNSRHDLLAQSPFLSEKVESHELTIVSGLYNMDLGKIHFKFSEKMASKIVTAVLNSDEAKTYAQTIDEVIEAASRKKRTKNKR
jgi:carbonic anhydrase